MSTATCPISNQTFHVTEEDQAFYQKMGVPMPTLCPLERNRRRMAYRNFRTLYQRACDGTGKSIITMYHADQPFPVYENDYWWSDAWDPLSYGREMDFSRPFFEQYHDLANVVPHYGTMNLQCENCKYANLAWKSKDSYLVFGCVRDEDCMYGHIVWDCRSCFDSLYLFRCELCSECVDCVDCYDTHFSTECSGCTDSFFLHDCRECRNCFGCINLRNKEYYFMNQPLGKEAYEKKMREIMPLSHDTIDMGKTWLEKAKKEQAVFPEKYALKAENCTGNHVYESQNCQESYDAKKCQDAKYIYTGFQQLDCHDVTFTGGGTKWTYESLTMFQAEDSLACHLVSFSNNAAYSEFCTNCEHILGCHGLRHQKNCILNTSYTTEEYESLSKKIIHHMQETKEWGEFFPIEHSPFAYNESIVNEYYPLTESEVLKRGLRWRDPEPFSQYTGDKYTAPQTIDKVPDDICTKILTCETSGKNYKIQTKEYAFYKNAGLPIPRHHPDIRHLQRMNLRNPRQLWNKKCTQCSEEITTTFDSDRPEKILCENCYLKVVH